MGLQSSNHDEAGAIQGYPEMLEGSSEFLRSFEKDLKTNAAALRFAI
jgi:hypothetical protein